MSTNKNKRMRTLVLRIVSLLLILLGTVSIFMQPEDKGQEVSHHLSQNQSSETEDDHQIEAEGAGSKEESPSNQQSRSDNNKDEDEEKDNTDLGAIGPEVFSPKIEVGETAEDNAKRLQAWLQAQGVLTEDDVLRPSVTEGKLGQLTFERVIQEHQSIPIYGSNILVLKKSGQIIQTQGGVAKKISINVEPSKTEMQASAFLKTSLPKIVLQSEGTLMILAQGQSSFLVWVFKASESGRHYDVLIDANNLKVLKQIQTGGHGRG